MSRSQLPATPTAISLAPAYHAPSWDGAAVLYGLFLLAVLLDIGGAFGLKYGAFALVLVYLAFVASSAGAAVPLNFLVIEGLLFVVAPAFFFYLAIAAFAVSPAAAAGRLASFTIWLLYPVLLRVRTREQLVTTFEAVMVFGALLVLIMFVVLIVLYVAGRPDLIQAINAFTDTHRIGYFGAKPLNDEQRVFFPGVYFRWSLLLLPAGILGYAKGRARFFAIAAAIVASASAAAIGALVIGVVAAAADQHLTRTERRLYLRRAAVLVIILGLVGAALYQTGLGAAVQLILAKLTSASTAMKVGHIRSIVDETSQSAGRVLFGMGVGSSFYSQGVGDIVTEVEVSHFDLVRQFGLPYALAFFGYVGWLAFAVRRVDRTGRLLAIGLVLLFLVAGTNPLLLTPVFFVPLVITRAYLALAAKERDVGVHSLRATS